MSSQDNRNNGTDWWLMDADGSDQRRLTHFNLPGYPEGSGSAVIDLGALRRGKIPLTIVGSANASTVAEHTLSFMLALARFMVKSVHE
jgi:hypothetical protein